jgi:hypothetical protein
LEFKKEDYIIEHGSHFINLIKSMLAWEISWIIWSL